jgi:colanic acid/amylovoran biosynthesis glycosyltransferase
MKMKILICTDSFERRTNGTALFPNFALKINELYPQHEVRILTPDVSQSYDKVFKIEFIKPFIVRFFDPLLRNINHFNALQKIRKLYAFDIVIFNNAADGVFYNLLPHPKNKVIGLIHDDDSLRLNFNNRFTYIFGYWIRKRLEKNAIRKFDNIICVSNYIRRIILTERVKNESKIKLLYEVTDIESITFKLQKKLVINL